MAKVTDKTITRCQAAVRYEESKAELAKARARAIEAKTALERAKAIVAVKMATMQKQAAGREMRGPRRSKAKK